jgi:hypothetical protein
MKTKFFPFIFFLALIAFPLHSAPSDYVFGSEGDVRIIVNNRVMAKVNGKAISIFDVMKKMDMLFFREFPEYSSSVQARFQFYQVSWKRILQDLVDKELIMADAEENKLQVSPGDVRQELESLFGPNIHANLDRVGLSYDEALKMIHSDIVLKRMIYLKANVKALKQVTPQLIRQTYEEYAKDNIRPPVWTYRSVSIRDKDPTKGAEAAHQIHKLLTEDGISLTEMQKRIKKMVAIAPSTTVNVSDPVKQNESELSSQNKEILTQVERNGYSQPIAQKSRSDGTTVFRIFYLIHFDEGGIVPFSEVAAQIKDKLLDEYSSKETMAYIKKLRKHFDVEEMQAADLENFVPFSLG